MNDQIVRCTGSTVNGTSCHMKQNCVRYLKYMLDDDVYKPINKAPDCIEFTPLECPLKITAHKEDEI